MSMMRVPVSEPPNTIRLQPSARCRSLSNGFSGRVSAEPKDLARSVKSGDEAARVICFRNSSGLPGRNNPALFGDVVPRHAAEVAGARPSIEVPAGPGSALELDRAPTRANQNPANPCGLL
jgi:hypothetical protein